MTETAYESAEGRVGTWRAVGRFALHLAEMVVAMLLGMFLLAPAWDWAGAQLGIGPLLARPDVAALVMVVNMVVGMAIWMRIRCHRWAAIAEMNAAMAAPFVVLLVPYWAGAIGPMGLMMAGHLLMVPAMVAVMLWRLPEYTGHTHGLDLRWPVTRWPTALALVLLVLTLAGGFSGKVPDLLIAGIVLFYPVVGLLRRNVRGRFLVTVQVAGLVVFGGLAVTLLAGLYPPEVALYVTAAYLLGHGVWDALHHRANAVVWRWYAEACLVFDLLLGLGVLAVAAT